MHHTQTGCCIRNRSQTGCTLSSITLTRTPNLSTWELHSNSRQTTPYPSRRFPSIGLTLVDRGSVPGIAANGFCSVHCCQLVLLITLCVKVACSLHCFSICLPVAQFVNSSSSLHCWSFVSRVVTVASFVCCAIVAEVVFRFALLSCHRPSVASLSCHRPSWLGNPYPTRATLRILTPRIPTPCTHVQPTTT